MVGPAPSQCADYANPLNGTIGISPGDYCTYFTFDSIEVDGCTSQFFFSHVLTGTVNRCSGHAPLAHSFVVAGANSMVFTGCLGQVANASGSVTYASRPANVYIGDDGVGSYPSFNITWTGGLIDEMGLGGTAGGSSLYIQNGVDVTINDVTVFAPGKQQSSGQPYYGVRIGALCKRVTLSRMRIQPYVLDAIRVPTHTILIEAGATGTVLADVTSDPNTLNGGGDLADLASDTAYRNVVLDGNPPITSIPTKAGVPSDTDWNATSLPPIGTAVLNTTDCKIYYRVAAGIWMGVALS